METNSPSTACLTNFALVAYQRACVYMCGLTCVCPCWMEVDVGFLFYDSLPNISGQGFSLSLEFTVWTRVAGYRTPKIFLSLPPQYTGIVGAYCQTWLSMGPGGLNPVLTSLWQTLCPWSHLPNCNECSGKKMSFSCGKAAQSGTPLHLKTGQWRDGRGKEGTKTPGMNLYGRN